MQSIRKKLQDTLTFTSILFLIIIIVGFFYSFYMTSSSNQEKLIDTNLSIIDQRLNDVHELQVTSLNIFINDIQKAILADKSIDALHVNTSIIEYEEIFDIDTSIAVGLEDGSMFTTNIDNLPDDYDPRIRPWYSNAILNSNEVILSQPYLTANQEEEGIYIVTYSKAVQDQNNNIIGVAGANVNLNHLFELSKDNQLKDKSFTAIASSDGQVIISNYYDLLTIQQIQIDPNNIDSSTPNNILIENIEYLVYGELNPTTNWISLVFIPKAATSQLLVNGILLSIFILVILLIFTRVYSSRMAVRISKPILDVVSRIETTKLRDHPTSFDFPESNIKEISTLTQGIDTLLHRVNDQRITLENNEQEISTQYNEIQALYEETTAMNESLNSTMDQLEDSWLQTIRALSNAIEASDIYTKGHCDRVASYSVEVGKAYGMSKERLKTLEIAALLHDIGKVGVPDRILNKEGKLTNEEYELIKKHPEIGYTIIKEIPYLAQAKNFILNHHERVDSKGYPRGLSVDDIEVESKILGVIDAYDAMTSTRSYRKLPLTKDQAINELLKYRGTQFDSEIVDILISLVSETNNLI